MIASIPWLQFALNFFLNRILIFLRLVPNIVTVPTFQRNYYQSLYCDFVPQYHSGSEAYCMNISQQDTILRWGVVSTPPNPPAGGPPLVGCPQLRIQYIFSYRIRGRSSIRNRRTRHAVVTGTHLSRGVII